METKTKPTILKTIGKLYKQSKKCKLKDEFFEQAGPELEELSVYFNTTKTQALFISLIFSLSFRSSCTDMDDLVNHLKCDPLKVLEFNGDFEILVSKGFLSKKKETRLSRRHSPYFEFLLSNETIEAILQNKPIAKTGKKDAQDVFEVLESLYDFGEKRDGEEISTRELFQSAGEIIGDNQDFPLIKKVADFKFDIADSYIFLYLVWKCITGKTHVDLHRATQGMYDNQSKRLAYIQEIISGENALCENKLVELDEAGFSNDMSLKLTNHSLGMLKECGIKLFMHKQGRDDITKPEDIPLRKLVYDQKETEQLTLFKSSLEEPAFSEIKKRLLEKGLPTGISALFHGAPGTGKTETVRQLAKEMDRPVIKVDISQTKSMWYGESEKIIKKVFTDYKSFAEECEKTPILLFNEADAVISKRTDVGGSNVGKTENAIQNILLEEMEDFEGILVATTNLKNNFDIAFERRFLFKVEFQKPGLSKKAKIWKLKLPGLSSGQCENLASQFDFSGGEIDNVARKNEIQQIISGNPASFEQLLVYCKEEKFGKKENKIGFDSRR